jgi:hypothetical protein
MVLVDDEVDPVPVPSEGSGPVEQDRRELAMLAAAVEVPIEPTSEIVTHSPVGSEVLVTFARFWEAVAVPVVPAYESTLLKPMVATTVTPAAAVLPRENSPMVVVNPTDCNAPLTVAVRLLMGELEGEVVAYPVALREKVFEPALVLLNAPVLVEV